MNTPYGKDVYGMLVTAFRKQGIKVGACRWHLAINLAAINQPLDFCSS